MGEHSLALVTGASSGIGRELACLCAAAGFDPILVGRRTEALDTLARDLRARHGVVAATVSADLATPSGVDAAWAAVGRRPLAVLINSAGFNVVGDLADTDAAAQVALIETHVVATVRLTRLALPNMLAAGRGHILNIGSIASYAPAPGDSVYAAAKSFILSFSDAVAAEVAGKGVTVTTLCPGATRTAFAERSGIERTWLFSVGTMDAGYVARVGFEAMMRGRRVVMPGFANRLMSVSAGLMPRAVRDAVARFIMSEVPARLARRVGAPH